jgi:hypothetical protein
MDGNTRIRGQLMAGNIYSDGRVDTSPTGGMSAGKDGFVTMLGGVSVGYPIAVSGNILCIGSINAGITVNAAVSMFSPIGNFGTMKAGLMSDTVNSGIFNSHLHEGFGAGAPYTVFV